VHQTEDITNSGYFLTTPTKLMLNRAIGIKYDLLKEIFCRERLLALELNYNNIICYAKTHLSLSELKGSSIIICVMV
jgi:hypothetical protein